MFKRGGKINIGVIGIGSWGSRVYPEYKKLEEENVIDNVYSCDKQKKADYKNYHDMLKNVDGVHICLPNKYHFEIAKKTLSQGKHVLVEKPMTTNTKEAHQLIEIASEQGLILQVGYILRFANVLRKTRELYNQGKFGDIYYTTMHWTAQTRYMEQMDIVWDLLPHPLDIMHFLTGHFPKVDKVQLLERHFRRDKLGEIALLNLDYGEFIANVELSWLTPIKRRSLFIYGNRASAFVECVKQELMLYENNTKKPVPITPNDTIRGEALNFVKCLNDGRNRFNSHIVGLQNTEVIEKIMENK